MNTNNERQKFEEKLGYMQMLQNCIIRLQFNLSRRYFDSAEAELKNLTQLLPKDIRMICLEKTIPLYESYINDYNYFLKSIAGQTYSKNGKLLKYYELKEEYLTHSLIIIKDELEESGMLYGSDVVRKSSAMVV